MRKSHEKWICHYASWKASGKTQAQYCKQNGIQYWSFKNKIYMLRNMGMIESSGRQKLGTANASKFQAVEIIAAAQEATSYCEIRFGDRDKISISSQESLKALKEMIQCIMQAS